MLGVEPILAQNSFWSTQKRTEGEVLKQTISAELGAIAIGSVDLVHGEIDHIRQIEQIEEIFSGQLQ